MMFHLAVERIAAAAQAARALKFPFILAARAHNFLYADPSLDDTISRLHAFEKAGADVPFAPGLSDLAAVRAVCPACQSLSTLWWESRENHFLWPNSPQPESGGSALRPHSIARR
jgi:2-methylisocitrate lyase-like PEP mutase family enzyme